ncbi:MAG TPA: serine/threonine-protein kinase [Myxococcaceae bacterium]
MSLLSLPLGTRVGAWRVLGFRGRGIYGTVYAAEPSDREQPGLAALKLAIYPADPRFEREAELLARIRHPSVPRLLDTGLWQAPSGCSHPFVVMECVEGVPLYTWAERCNPSSRQVLALLAHAAGALQATHEVSSVHRDVKGDNMLVRPSDGRLFLTDFGTGYFAGAKRLTPMPVLPGTPAYRSPEMWRNVRRAGPGANAPLMTQPADDVFALGVTAYRLVTDTYPPFTDPYTPEGQCWLPGGRGIPPPRQLNPRVDAQLNALILRMLSPRPKERGTGGELAEAMERGVAHAGPLADTPLFEWETQAPSEWTEEERAQAAELGHRPRRRIRQRARELELPHTSARGKPRRWLPWLAAVLALGLWPAEPGSLRSEAPLTAASGGSTEETDTVSLGDSSVRSSDALAKPPKDAIAQELPKQPRPGQRRPDAKGRCPKEQIAINGGCWRKLNLDPDECRGHDVYLYQGGCYFPIPASQPQPTSGPADSEH